MAYIDGLTAGPLLFIIVSSKPGDVSSGFHFLSLLKARKLPFTAPVFLLTDRPTKDDTVYAHQFGAASFVAKPDNEAQWEQYLALIWLHYVYAL